MVKTNFGCSIQNEQAIYDQDQKQDNVNWIYLFYYYYYAIEFSTSFSVSLFSWSHDMYTEPMFK